MALCKEHRYFASCFPLGSKNTVNIIVVDREQAKHIVSYSVCYVFAAQNVDVDVVLRMLLTVTF